MAITGGEIISMDGQPMTLNEFLNIIKALLEQQSTAVNEFPPVDSLQGISSLPALRGATVVTVPLSLLHGQNGRSPRPNDEGFWEIYDIETETWESTGQKVQGPVGTSFIPIAQCDTLEELLATIPDGEGIDAVVAVGAAPPYDYYAWTAKDGIFAWRNQGKITGESAFDLWKQQPGNEDKTYENYLTFNQLPALAAAEEAKKQAAYAKEEGDKASVLSGEVEYLQKNKADGMEVIDQQLYLTSGGEPITEGIDLPSGSGSGSGGGGSTIRLKNLIGSSLVSIAGQPLELKYSFSSVDSEDGTETGDGTATYYVNSIQVLSENIAQGDVSKDISRYLKKGNNAVRVTVQDSYGSSRSLNWKVEVADVSISSTFDSSLIYTSDIEFRYIPVGLHEKTIHFLVDNIEIGTEVTSVSNRELVYTIPSQTHGAHRLEVYATIEVLGVIVRSNNLVYDLICVSSGDTTVVIASGYNESEVYQYSNLSIPFIVYNPSALETNITLLVNDETISEQTVDRTQQAWNYRVRNVGELVLEIVAGNIRKTFNLTVLPAEVVVEPETRGLQLYLTAADRSNNDNNREEWKYESIEALLTGFNFKTNGWLANDGSVALRVSGDARVSIPFKIFSSDFRAFGKTIEFEFETSDVSDYETTLIDCMNSNIGFRVTPQLAIFRSEQTTVETRFKEDERVRVSFVIEKRSEHRLIYIYVNGVFSGVAQYPDEDNFQQREPAPITIGSNSCTIDLYNIRIYDSNLTQYQLLDNYIGDIDDIEKKIALYHRNQVYNDYGDISYSAILEQIPCLIITGDLPTYKGDKKTVKLDYTDLLHPQNSYVSENVQIDVQGTSSQYYPRKNFKTKHRNGFIMNGENKSKYPLRPDSIAVDTFCFKADFAESSGAHNTGLAKVVDRLLKKLNLLTPPQKTDSKVRTTIDGFPIAIFHRPDAESDLEFVGKYNFNNDKSTNATFGFDAGDESWEFLNNTSDRVLFKNSDYSTDDWKNDFEGRYPDGNTDFTNLKEVTDWIVSTKDDTDKFKAEVREHFDLNNLISYYLFTELFAMVDQRAKNMFLTTWGKENGSLYNIWRFIFYDNDTAFGINNEGLIAFGFNVEYHDKIGTQDVWNGEQSVLWNNIETCFPDEIQAMYQSIRSNGFLSYDLVMDELNTEQSDKWCEAIYNADGRFKYVDPLIQDGNGSYLYAAQGSRVEHRKWWTYNRFRYMDSKYVAGDFLQDFATLRLYTPDSWEGVEPNANFLIVPFADQYVRVKYGSYILGSRGKKDVPVPIHAPDIRFNDTETIVYGASRLKSLGDLSGMYAGSIDMSQATKLTELLIGSGAEGYQNTNLAHLSVGNNKMLRTLDIRNCPNLKQAVDLSGCESIERILADGTGVTSVILPQAGILNEMHLPGSIANLTIKNQPNLTDANFSLEGVNNLTTLVYENSGGVDIFGILERCFELETPVLSRVRVLNINGQGANLNLLYELTKIGGLDESGNNAPMAIVTGKYHADVATQIKLDELAIAFPELKITYSLLDPPTVVTFDSSKNKEIINPSFVCNFPFKKINASVYHVTAEEGSLVEFTLTSDNHKAYSGRFEVDSARSVTYSIAYIPQRTIRVREYNTTIYVSSAKIAIGDKIYSSDINGNVYLRSGDAVSGQVTAVGYSGGIFSFAAITDDTVNTLDVYPKVDVVFNVKNSSNEPLSGAIVKCDGVTQTTNNEGICTLKLSQEPLEYNITCNGALPVNGTVNPLYTKVINVTMVSDPTIYKPIENGNIQLMFKGGRTVYLKVTSSTTNYIIDWGDGTQTAASGTGAKNYTHIYDVDQYYQAEVQNCEDVTDCNASENGSLAAYWSIGNSLVNGLKFSSFTNLIYVGYVFKNDGNRLDFSSCFYYCTALLSFPSDILDGINYTSALKFGSFMRACVAFNSTLPELWVLYSSASSSNKSLCFANCDKALNYHQVPYDWGGQLYEDFAQLLIFKDNEWYLNQNVTVGGYQLNQNADGSYSGNVKRFQEGNMDILVNGIYAGYTYMRKTKYMTPMPIFIGDSSLIVRNDIWDLSISPLPDSFIKSNSNWYYDENKGGYICGDPTIIYESKLQVDIKSDRYGFLQPCTMSVTYDLIAPDNQRLAFIFTERNASSYSAHITPGIDMVKEVHSLNGFNITAQRYTAKATSEDYILLKKIQVTGRVYEPPLPDDFVPTVIQSNQLMSTLSTPIGTSMAMVVVPEEEWNDVLCRISNLEHNEH